MAGSDTYVRFQASQAGPFTESANVVDLYLPGDACYDLADSYVSIWASMSTTDTAPASGTGVYSTAIKINGTTNGLDNALLVKNCSMSCQGRGQLENIRAQDVLHAATSVLNKSQRQNASDAYLSANTLVEPKGQQHYSMFQDIRKTGTTLSSQQEAPIQIRLGDIMDVCNSRLYDARRLGQSHIRLELNCPNADGVTGKVRGYQTIPNAITSRARFFQNIPDPAGPYNWDTVVTNNLAAGANYRGISSETDFPYYVGMKCTFSATSGGGAPAVANVERVITGIAFNESVGTVTLTLNSPLSTMAAGHTYTAVQCTGVVQPATIPLTFNRVELTAKKLGNPPPINEPLMLSYTTFSTQQDVGPAGITNFERQYMCEPDSDAVLITFPDIANIYSTNTDINSFRLRINQVDVTDRDVVVRSPLYYDRLAALIEAMGYDVRDLQENPGDCTAATYALSYPAASKLTFAGCKLPQLMNEKALQVSVTLGANEVGNIVLHKRLPRSIIL